MSDASLEMYKLIALSECIAIMDLKLFVFQSSLHRNILSSTYQSQNLNNFLLIICRIKWLKYLFPNLNLNKANIIDMPWMVNHSASIIFPWVFISENKNK